MNILLIYETIPDDLKIYRLHNVSLEDGEKLSRCHGIFDNTKVFDNTLSDWLSEYLLSVKECIIYDSDNPQQCSLRANEGYQIIATGFVL